LLAGVFRVKEETKVYIDVGDVAELKSLTTKPNLVLGANMSLTEAMDTFNSISKENARYKYIKALADHIDLIANVPVRNVSTPFFMLLTY
jgi:CO/xanthine dehydrogenase FAD-binding subunit